MTAQEGENNARESDTDAGKCLYLFVFCTVRLRCAMTNMTTFY